MKNIIRKGWVALLAAMVFTACLPASIFAEEGSLTSQPNKDNSIISGTPDVYGTDGYSFSFDFKTITQGDNTQYSKELAEMASLIATDEYHPGGINLTSKILSIGKSVPKQLGFEDIERIHLKQSDYETDQNDTLAFTMGRREVKTDGQTSVVYLLSLRGSVDPWELSANSDDGAWTEDYTDLTGEHPEWLEELQDVHKSTAIVSNRVMEHLTQYFNKFAASDGDKQQIILITGHSRGAGVANLIGKYFEDEQSVKSFTYTFATPQVAVIDAETAAQYKTIFNILNDDDFIVYNPLPCKEFRRYGRDVGLSIGNDSKLVKLWSDDGFGDMLLGFAPKYLMEMLGVDERNSLITGLLGREVFESFLEYESANGAALAEAKSHAINCTREGYYEKRDLVWVPADISEAYEMYYEDAPATGEEDTEKYRQFVAEHPDYKRVRMRPAMFDLCKNRAIESLLSGEDGGLDAIVEIIEAFEQYGIDNDLDALLSTLSKYPDLQVLCSILSVRQNDDIEAGHRYLESFTMLADDSGILAVLTDHVPTTYYFLTHQYNAGIEEATADDDAKTDTKTDAKTDTKTDKNSGSSELSEPDTGDSSSPTAVMCCIAMLLCSAASIVLLRIKKRRQ